MKYDCVVIGSGISGLSAALLLARGSKKVAIIEKNRFLSPMLRDFMRNGIPCNPGFHYSGGFYKAGPASVLFNYFGVSEKIKVSPLPETEIFSNNDKILSLPVSLENFSEKLFSAFPADASAIEKYIDAVREINTKTCFMNFENGFGDYPEEFFNSNESLEEFLLKHKAGEKLIYLLGNYSYALYGANAREVPFHLHALAAGSVYSSASVIEGGAGALAGIFESLLKKAGADIITGKAVSKIRVGDRRILQGVELSDGTFIECRECVFTAHPGLLKNIIPENAVRPVFFKKLELYENTFSPFVLFLETDNPFNKNFYRISGTVSDPDFLCVFSEGKAVTVLKPCSEKASLDFLNSDDDKYSLCKKEYSEKIISEFTEFFPEMKGRLKVLEALSPRSYQRYTGSINGSMYGLKKTVSNGELNPLTDVKGFYLAGQSVKVPGITGALVSALSASCHILDPLKLWKDLKQYIY